MLYNVGPCINKIDEETRNNLVTSTPLGRQGYPSDVAEAVYFLANDGASFITGQNLIVDGGFTL